MFPNFTSLCTSRYYVLYAMKNVLSRIAANIKFWQIELLIIVLRPSRALNNVMKQLVSAIRSKQQQQNIWRLVTCLDFVCLVLFKGVGIFLTECHTAPRICSQQEDFSSSDFDFWLAFIRLVSRSFVQWNCTEITTKNMFSKQKEPICSKQIS